MPRIIPEARYFSMPSTGVGAEVLRNRALNWCPSGTVVDPVAGGCNPLAGRYRGGMADQGDQLAVATGLNPQDAKAVLGVLVSDALDQSGEHFVIGWCALVLHNGRHTLAVISKVARNVPSHESRVWCPAWGTCLTRAMLTKPPSGRAKLKSGLRYPPGVLLCPRICPGYVPEERPITIDCKSSSTSPGGTLGM